MPRTSQIRENWEDIREAFVEAFRLIASFGLNDASLRAKNAVLPIVYYLFHKGRDPSSGARGLFTLLTSRSRTVPSG